MLCRIFLIARQHLIQLQRFNVVFSRPPVASFVTMFVASDGVLMFDSWRMLLQVLTHLWSVRNGCLKTYARNNKENKIYIRLQVAPP